MKTFSEEKIEIAGNEYVLFLNRKGIVSWEKITTLQKQAKEMEKKYEMYVELSETDTPIEVKDGDNPFEISGGNEVDDLTADEEKLKDIYVKFYWIALYENHKLPISEVKALFQKAEEEYGLEQLIGLANQMVEDANTDRYGAKTKKLKALRPTKK
jgi:hypothetical protein